MCERDRSKTRAIDVCKEIDVCRGKIYICIYREGEKERERERVYIEYLYVCAYLYRYRE